MFCFCFRQCGGKRHSHMLHWQPPRSAPHRSHRVLWRQTLPLHMGDGKTCSLIRFGLRVEFAVWTDQIKPWETGLCLPCFCCKCIVLLPYLAAFRRFQTPGRRGLQPASQRCKWYNAVKYFVVFATSMMLLFLLNFFLRQMSIFVYLLTLKLWMLKSVVWIHQFVKNLM